MQQYNEAPSSVRINSEKACVQFFPKVERLCLLGIFTLFLLLLARNPFSERTLIPNLEPFPDTFHYLVPPRCAIAGNGWKLCRATLPGTSVAVPPLYGVLQLPLLIFSSAPNLFYVVNVLLAASSFFLIYLILQRINIIWFVRLLILLLFATSFHMYWLPTLAMAENLLIPLFLLFVLLLTYPISKTKICMAACVAASMYGTKYAAVPVFGAASLVYVGKILIEQEKSTAKTVIKNLAIFILPAGLLYLFFGGITTLSSIASVLLATQSAGTTTQSSASEWHTVAYVPKHLPIYWRMLQGHSATFLWDTRPLLAPIFAVLGWIGFGLGLLQKNTRVVAVFLLIAIISQIITLSFFYTTDARYIVVALPALLIGTGIALDSVVRLSNQQWWRYGCLAFICLLSGIAFLTHANRLKSQISLNLKYSESPWWYISVKNTSSYFETVALPEKPVLITAVSPFLFDLYGVTSVEVQPLSPELDFRGHKAEVWGSYDYSDLSRLYKEMLRNGRQVYLLSYGIGNETDRQYWLQKFLTEFKTEIVQEGCYGVCNIYKLSLTNSTDALEIYTK